MIYLKTTNLLNKAYFIIVACAFYENAILFLFWQRSGVKEQNVDWDVEIIDRGF